MAGLQYQDIVNAQGGTATNAQTGEVTTAPMTTINPQPTNPSAGQPVVINPVQTTGAPPLQLPQPDTNLATADATVTGSSQTAKTLQDYLNQLEAPKTALDGQNQALMDRLSSLYGSNVGRAQETAKLEDSSGLNTLKKQFADLNSQILTKNAEYLKLRDMTEQNSNLKGSFSAKDTQLARAQAADVGLLQARALGMQGQVNASQDAIDRAIDLKYKGIEEEITAKEKQMALIAPLLTAQQAKVAQAQERMYADEKERIAEKKAEAKENLNLIFTSGLTNKFVNRGGKFIRASDGKVYGDQADPVKEFFRDAGVSSFEEAYQRGLVGDLTSDLIADRDSVLKLRETYPDAGINITDDWQTAVDKLGGSNKYARENPVDNAPNVQNINGVASIYNPETGMFEPVAMEGNVGSAEKYLKADGTPAKLLAGQVDTISAFDSTVSQAQKALDLLNNGVQTGPIELGKLLAGKLTNKANSNQLSYEQKIAMIRADFMKAISGATVSEPERKRLEAFLPVFTDQEGVAKSKLENLVTELGMKKNLFLDTMGVQQNPSFIGPFNSAGNASASNGNKVLGVKETIAQLPLLNPDGSNKTPNLPLTKVYPQGSYPSGKKGSLANQCGYFVRSVVQKMGFDYPRVGDTLASKAAVVKKYGTNGGVGKVLITNESKKNGHVAYIIGRTDKGWRLAESNYKLDGKINYGRIIPFNSPSIVGYLQPDKKA